MCMKYNCESIYNHCGSHFYNDFSYLLKDSGSIHDVLKDVFDSLKPN